ncbi:MAG TPA: hypothetical protein VJ254_10590, partial [Streptosporangiaceae bacterium]|nr:hypothetical protein [Streptosporangiaceae bacterium]
MIVNRNGLYLSRTVHDHGIALQDGTLGGEAGAEAACMETGGVVEGLDGVGEATLAPGQAGGQHWAGAVV